MADEAYHAPNRELSTEIHEMHRAITPLMAE